MRPGHGLSPLFPRDERDGPRALAGGRFINAWAEWSRGDTGTRARVAAVRMCICICAYVCVFHAHRAWKIYLPVIGCCVASRRVASHRSVSRCILRGIWEANPIIKIRSCVRCVDGEGSGAFLKVPVNASYVRKLRDALGAFLVPTVVAVAIEF